MMLDWEALYQDNDTGWDRGGVSPALLHWLASDMPEAAVLKQQSARVLIPGCGRGYEVVELAKRGFDVTGIDIAPSAISSLENSLDSEKVEANAEVADVFVYQGQSPFDVIYEQTCLCALPVEKRAAYETQLCAWLRTGGILLLSMMQTGELDGPPFHCDWTDMRQLFDEERWLWQQEVPFVVPRWRASPRFELGFVLQKK